MDLHLQNHLAVITGGASGIGRATAECFAAEGCRVALWDLSPQVEQVAAEIAARYSVAAGGWSLNTVDEAAVNRVTAETIAKFGPIDHLVHAAATGSGKFGFPFTNLQPADWKKVLDVNILGLVHVAHAVAPGMRDRKQGTFLCVSSVAGQFGSQTDPPYSASKAAGINFIQCLAKDLAPHNVRCNSLCPGMVQTPLNRRVWQAWNDQQPADKQRTYEDWSMEKIQKIVPLGRWQEPEDIANMLVFLSSDRAQHVTGQTINVDGGFVMHW